MPQIVVDILASKTPPLTISPEILKAGREGLIPIRKTVTRGTSTYESTFWVKPKDLRKMDLENAANFMSGMIKAQKYFKQALEKLDSEASMDSPLKQAAAEIRTKMEATGNKLIELGELKIELAEHSRANPVSGDAMLAAIQSKPDSVIPHKIKGLITALYQDVSTTTFGHGLMLSSDEGSSTVRTSAAVKSTQWDAASWSNKMKDIMKKKIAEVKGIFSFRKVAPSNAALVIKEGLKRTPTLKPEVKAAVTPAQQKIKNIASKIGTTPKPATTVKPTRARFVNDELPAYKPKKRAAKAIVIDLEKAGKEGLAPKKRIIHRGASVYQATVYVRPDQEKDVHTPASVMQAMRAAGLSNVSANMFQIPSKRLEHGVPVNTRTEIKEGLLKRGHTDEEVGRVMEHLGKAGTNNPKKVKIEQVDISEEAKKDPKTFLSAAIYGHKKY